MDAGSSYEEIKCIVCGAEIHTLLGTMRSIFYDIKTKCVSHVISTKKIAALRHVSIADVRAVVKLIDHELVAHGTFSQYYRSLTARIKGCFGIDADVLYGVQLEETSDGVELITIFKLVYANGFNLFESRALWFDHLVEYFAGFNPPIGFFSEPPPSQ